MRPNSGEAKRRITIDLSPELKKKLDKIGEFHDLSNSEVIRAWIRGNTDLEKPPEEA